MAIQNAIGRTAGRGAIAQAVSRAAAPTIIRDPTLVGEWAFSEQTGGYVWNRVYPIPATPNLFANPEQLFSQASSLSQWNVGAGTTVTDNFAASPQNDQTASRVVITAGNAGYVQQTMALTSGASYTVGMWVSSNTGLTQNVRIRGANSFGSNVAIPATGWAWVTGTLTAGGGTQGWGIAGDSATPAVDILIWGATLARGNTALPYTRPTGELFLGRPSASSTAGTWSSRGVSFLSASSQYAAGMFYSAPSFRNASFYVVFKRIANPNPSNTFNFLVGSYNTGTSLNITTANGSQQQNQWSGGGVIGMVNFILNGQPFGSGITDPYDGNWHCLACVYDGSNGITYLDGVEFARTASTLVTSWTQQQWFINVNGATRYGDNEINYLLAYNTAHSAAQVLQNTNALRQILIGRGVPSTQAIPDANNVSFVVYEGDSIANAQGIAGWPALTNQLLSPVPIGRTTAITGSFADTATVQASQITFRRPYLATLWRPTRRANVIQIHSGANDLNTTGAVLPRYIQWYKELAQSFAALGWKVVMLSTLPNNRAGTTGVYGSTTVDDMRDYASTPANYTSSSNYALRNWTPPARVTWVDCGYGYIDACPVTAYFLGKWTGLTPASPGYSVTVNLSGGSVVTGAGGITINSPGTNFIEIPTCQIFGGNGTGATATVTDMSAQVATKSAGGSGYAVNDTITLAPRGGDTFAVAPVLKVTAVSGGAVTAVSVQTAGDATALAGTNAVFSQASTSGAGTGATFTIGWGLLGINVTAGGSGYTNTGLYSVANPIGPFAQAVYFASGNAPWDATYYVDGTHPQAGLCSFVANAWVAPAVRPLL